MSNGKQQQQQQHEFRYIQQGGLGLRHWCEQGDNLQQFGWNKHDGKFIFFYEKCIHY